MQNKYKHFDWESVGFDFGNWEEELVWALDIPTQEINIEKLIWHFDIPYWENDLGERWTVTPQDVMNQEVGTAKEHKRVEQSDTTYPLDLYEHGGKLFVLDGLHRLVKLYVEGKKNIQARIVPKERFHEVKSEHPFELPNQIPDIIKEVGFDFSWDSEDVWKLDYPTEEMPIGELTWHFDIPFWDSEGTDAYNLKPWDLIHSPEKEPTHMDHIDKADMKYPIDIMENNGRWVILDGLHRLVKAYLASLDTVQVRKIPRSEIPNIAKG